MDPRIVRYSQQPDLWDSWEAWTAMAFPGTGDYVFPAGLATVHIDRDTNRGDYWEPNIWIIHPLTTRASR